MATETVDYDRVWSEWGDMSENAPSPIHTRRLILNEAAKLTFNSVLDIGCGNGILISAAKRRFPDVPCAGADIAQTAIDRARRRWKDISFHQFDIQERSLNERFDLILFSEVIEHLEHPERAVQNIRKMCSGYLILTTPTGSRLPTDLAFHHLKHFTSEELRALVESNGFQVIRLYLWGWPFQILFRRLINMVPNMAHKQFVSGGNYGLLKRLTSVIWTGLFYLNVEGKGTQQVLVAKIR